MDLRSIINTEAGEAGRSKQNAPTPVTPIQTVPPPGQPFRNYSHSSQASPGLGKHGSQSQEYGSQNGGPYASPTTYQGTHLGRPPPPTPIQAPPPTDLRSPAGSYSAASPYRHTPTSSISAAGGQYPFPQNHQNPQSPAQHQHYPPTFHQRESFSHPNPPPHLQHHNSQVQASPAPQTPPIGIPGAPHPYLQHQRSQSSLSNSTPNSAHSQQQQQQQQPQQYHNQQFTQESPIGTHPYPPNQIPVQHQRQQSLQSQPGTPLGPPLQTQRQSSGGFVQPTSPYQHRAVSASPFTLYNQTSPAPPPASIPPRNPTTPRSAYDSHRTSTSSTQQRSISERERSLSVSPKTRLPSQTRMNSVVQLQPEEYNNPAKRKMEDREMSVEAPRQHNHYEVKTEVNGEHQISPVPAPSPQQRPKKRIRYTEPPIWAQSAKGMKNLGRKLNGKQQMNDTPTPPPAALIKQESNGLRQASPAVARVAPPDDVSWDGPLGPWEPSITGRKPFDEIPKIVADWLYVHVASRSDVGELASRGVEIEIEAKLGQLISKDTGMRVQLPIRTETVLTENSLLTFRSSMTEYQHKVLNDYLNARLTDTHPGNPSAPKKRLKIDYLHRREKDKFYELPSSAHTTLPPALRSILNPRHSVKVRVTHDQKTNQILAKIIKARVRDLDIHFPGYPLDCRISINLEMRYDGDVDDLIAGSDGPPRPDRNKDRLSYTHSHYQVDLTQVTQSIVANGVTRTEKEHELEIEISTDVLTDQAGKASRGEPNDYLKLVEGLIDNVRVVARVVPQPNP